jgi:DNA polymerase V
MIDKNLETNMVGLYIGYDIENLKNGYSGTIKKDYYGRSVPKESVSRINLDNYTKANTIIEQKTVELFNKITDDKLLIRRIGISFGNLKKSDDINKTIQLDLFNKKDNINEKEENDVEKAVISIKKKYGKNSLLRGIDLLEGATAKDRNNQIGGHRA